MTMRWQMAELMRHTIIRQAREQELIAITTNSDGSPERRSASSSVYLALAAPSESLTLESAW